MTRNALIACLLVLLPAIPSHAVQPAGGGPAPAFCAADAARDLPRRRGGSRSGTSFVRDILRVSGDARDRLVAEQVLSGNIPDFLRAFTPVTLHGASAGAGEVDVTICVAPDYLAVGDNRDFVRVPLGLPAAASIADELGYLLPTTKMVDAIHAQARVRFAPKPMPPTAQMQSTEYFWRHNQTVNEQRSRSGERLTVLTAGQKKDIVLSNRLRAKPGRVAIYGWHRQNGDPIQPLSTVHQAGYADYSHGMRLVGPIAFVNGEPRRLVDILQDSNLSRIVSAEGAIAAPQKLLRSLR